MRSALSLLALLVCAPLSAQTAHYRKDGPALLNDLQKTPGDVRTTDLKKLCPHADTKAVRHVTEATKKAACREYGVLDTQCTGARYEIDHLISLELGGSNALTNLWPEPYAGAYGARTKDRVEDWLHGQVCSGKIPLRAAQHWIAIDWYAEWRLMVKK